MYLNVQCFDFAAQHGTPAIVELHTHQAGGKFHYVGFQAEILEGIGRLQTQQATADHDADFGLLASGLNHAEIVDGAIHQTVGQVGPGNRRYKGVGAGGQYQFVVTEAAATLGGDCFGFPVNGCHGIAEVGIHADGFVMLAGSQCQLFRFPACEVFRQVNPVVSGAGFSPEHGDFGGNAGSGQLFHVVVAHHSISYNDNFQHVLLPAIAYFISRTMS